ncbi:MULTISPECIES: dTDP-4-dehydrorhamnose reductase [Asticcacaulis]|uniref:dTDP-4-dehydrorhamnose reductase n=1 Tax=Asticcacaulis TaxID=76890 RepID=UPI001AEAF693|nr:MULTISPECIES: dTDP-4-dehydrorhamnose reductase [Asticcacaulis]MBP2159775.1 dTDP-4-dehydrorhamnose reductase [Asticcacaulis solisilvae]MDR6800820.1 dTDP-4-dehydrorhamnose reductase [Asticcacaulis sp. BE141]
MRIVVTGKEGQVDTSLAELGEKLGIEIVRVGLPEVDLSKPETLAAPIKAAKPDVIISSAAYTAVDKAESETDLAQAINGDGPGELARIAAELNIPILHLSTDYVFAGDKDGVYDENDTPAPVSVYGKTKLSGEEQIRAATEDHVILRTAWVYSPYGNNFVKTMLRLGETRDELNVVADQNGCPTYAPEIARALLTVAQRVAKDSDPALRGTFHLTGQGETTWAGFAEAIFAGSKDRGGKFVTVNPIPTSAYPTPAQRPANSRLSGEKLAATYDLRLDPWRVSLNDCLTRLTGVAASQETTV